MAKIIQQRERKTHSETKLNFYDKITGEIFYAFPLINGQLTPCKWEAEANAFEPCPEEECPWWQNYLDAKDNSEFYSEIETYTWDYSEPAIAICECGKEIRLERDAQPCEHCGRLHNLFGQELLPERFWGEDDCFVEDC